MGVLGGMILAGNTLASDVITFGADIRAIIAITALVVILLFIAVLPVYEHVRKTVGAAAQPAINEHDISPTAHPDLHEAIAILRNTTADLQRQIDAETANRREVLEGVQRRLDTAIRLLDRDE